MIFHLCVAAGVILRIIENFLFLGQTSSPTPDFLRAINGIPFLAQPFVVSAYLICIGSWLKLFFTLTEIWDRAARISSATAHASIQDMFKKKKNWPKTLIIPICLVLGVLNGIICLIVFIILLQDATASIDAKKGGLQGVLFGISSSMYFLLSILFGVYVVFLLRTFKMRIRSKTARSIVTRVVVLCIFLAICFLFRGIGCFFQPSLDGSSGAAFYFFFYFFTDIIPVACTIWLQTYNTATVSTTANKQSRGMWTTNS